MKNNIKYITIATILLALTVAYLGTEGMQVVYSEPTWNCEKIHDRWQCTVSFEIKNPKRDEQIIQLSIRGVNIPPDTRHSSLKICGEKLNELSISPLEIIKINEIIQMTCRPSDMYVKIWK